MTQLTAVQKLKHLILLKMYELDDKDTGNDFDDLTGEKIDNMYDESDGTNSRYDAMSEIREGTVKTSIPCPISRHYETDSVGMEYIDGTWIGWTYYYGGGKHGCPEDIEWIDDAYDIVCIGVEVITIKKFKKDVQCHIGGNRQEI